MSARDQGTGIRPGTLRHRVTLESLATSVGDGGRKVETYSPVATVWASIRPGHHPPQVRGNKTEYPVSHEITVRYAAGYEDTRRITFGARRFDVRSTINPDELNTHLVFRCEEV